ncbi:MAG: penicillin-binding protein activator, partial [Nitrospinales bacterium]
DLAVDPNVIGIIGPMLSRNVQEIAPLAEKYQIPVFTPTASSAGLTSLNPYVFRNAMTREIQGKFLAQYAVNTLNLRRFVVLYPEEPYGEELKNVFSEEVQSLGGEVIALVSYQRSQNDFKDQILEIGGVSDRILKKLTAKELSETQETVEFQGDVPLSKPLIERGLWNEGSIEGLKVSLELSYDAIFIPGFYDKVGLIAPQLAFYNIDQVTLLGANGWNRPELVELAGQYLTKSGIFIDGFFVHSKEDRIKDFVEDFAATFGEEPTIFSAQAFDTAQILLKLIRDGAGTREQLKTRLHSVKNYPGVSGDTSILPSGDSEKKLFALKVQGKTIVPVD